MPEPRSCRLIAQRVGLAMMILFSAIIGIICIVAIGVWLNPIGPKSAAEIEADKYFRLHGEDNRDGDTD